MPCSSHLAMVAPLRCNCRGALALFTTIALPLLLPLASRDDKEEREVEETQDGGFSVNNMVTIYNFVAGAAWHQFEPSYEVRLVDVISGVRSLGQSSSLVTIRPTRYSDSISTDRSVRQAVLHIADTYDRSNGNRYGGAYELARFASIANGLSVRVFAGAHENNKLTFLREYIADGVSFRSAGLHKIGWDDSTSRLLASQLVWSLVKWEEMKIVHRDIRPATFLISPGQCVNALKQLDRSSWFNSKCKVMVMTYHFACTLDADIVKFAKRDIACKLQPWTAASDTLNAPEAATGQMSTTTDVYTMGLLLCQIFSQSNTGRCPLEDSAETKIPPGIIKLVKQMLGRVPATELWKDASLSDDGTDNKDVFRNYAEKVSQLEHERWHWEATWTGGWQYPLPKSAEDDQLTRTYTERQDAILSSLNEFVTPSRVPHRPQATASRGDFSSFDVPTSSALSIPRRASYIT